MSEVKPWEQQPGEPDRCYSAFTVYRGLSRHERNLDKVSQAIAKKLPYVKNMSTRYGWVARVNAYDSHLDAVSLAVVEKGIVLDREGYRKRVQNEAQQLADHALTLIRRAMASEDINQMANGLAKGAAVWERARQIEGIALGIAVSQPTGGG